MRFAKKIFLIIGSLSVTGLAAFSQSPSLSTVLDNLRSTDSEVRLSAARSLPWLSQDAADPRTLVGQLTPLLGSSDAHVRLSILTAFQMMVLLQPEEAAIIAESKSTLIKATEDPLEDVRQYATAVLGLVVQPATDEDLKKVVIRGLADPSHKVR